MSFITAVNTKQGAQYDQSGLVPTTECFTNNSPWLFYEQFRISWGFPAAFRSLVRLSHNTAYPASFPRQELEHMACGCGKLIRGWKKEINRRDFSHVFYNRAYLSPIQFICSIPFSCQPFLCSLAIWYSSLPAPKVLFLMGSLSFERPDTDDVNWCQSTQFLNQIQICF